MFPFYGMKFYTVQLRNVTQNSQGEVLVNYSICREKIAKAETEVSFETA